ncbi:MAG: hypothetical protein DWQ37_10305 [Planctomycetota bacterium]|nr:MAG: hypothetical protein DWQ37_10305 [Planctomycetota bacterium]
MEESIKVTVVEFSDRKCYQMQYRDPMTGKKKTRSTGVERVTGRKKERDAALREAAKWEQDLQAGRYVAPNKITWADFRERYEAEALSGLAESSHKKTAGVLDSVEKILSPDKLRSVTAARLSYYQAKLRERGLAESTIKGHLAHLGAALNWANRVGLLEKVPTIERPKRAKASKLMKGRPITTEEFERMLAKVRAVVVPKPPKGKPVKPDPKQELADAERVESWKHYLRGLWFSGLRLGESLELSWDDRSDRISVDMSGKRPMLRIPAALEKGNQDRLLPMAPEFAEFLAEIPADQRAGYVFNPGTQRHSTRLSDVTVGRAVSLIGRAAGVKVSTDPASGKVKYASAHDLRRSFGERWASRVMPQILMELMRHESIETTLKYYVGRNAQTTADVLWAAHEAASNTSGNSGINSTPDGNLSAGTQAKSSKGVKV